MERNTMRDMVGFDYGYQRVDKSQELNASMSIAPQAEDEYGNKIVTLQGGISNASE